MANLAYFAVVTKMEMMANPAVAAVSFYDVNGEMWLWGELLVLPEFINAKTCITPSILTSEFIFSHLLY